MSNYAFPVVFDFIYSFADTTFTISPPFERPDLVIAEDVIEEIGRIHGYEHVPSIAIEPIPLREVNKRFFYAEQVRDALVEIGFSEIFTSSFRNLEYAKDIFKLRNALASDKEYLRSKEGILSNMREALQKNAPVVDLFGSKEQQVCLFEIGTTFGIGDPDNQDDEIGEHEVIALGVQSKQGWVVKNDLPRLNRAFNEVKKILAIPADSEEVVYEGQTNYVSINFTKALEQLPQPTAYTAHEKSPDITYKPFSMYPYLTRDIAFWTPEGTEEAVAEKVIRESAGPLAYRIDCFDTFRNEKEGRVSFGFRIVFQSCKKTLTGDEADALMQTVSNAVVAKSWEVR